MLNMFETIMKYNLIDVRGNYVTGISFENFGAIHFISSEPPRKFDYDIAKEISKKHNLTIVEVK